MKQLQDKGIPTTIHYPIPAHLQECFEDLGHEVGDFPIAEGAAKEVFSLPMSAFIKSDQLKIICSFI